MYRGGARYIFRSCFLKVVILWIILGLFSTSMMTNDDEVAHHFREAPQLSGSDLLNQNCSRFLQNTSTGRVAGNGRAILALLLTDIRYHGVRRLKETLPSWIKNFLLMQGNVDMALFYAYPVVTAAHLITTFGLKKAEESQLSPLELQFRDLHADVSPDVSISYDEWALLKDGYYYYPGVYPTFVFRLVPVNLTFPLYIQQNWTRLKDPTWMRCGCPPYCPLHRSPPEYIQGTRWYSNDIFNQPIVRRYSFWIKLDVDVAFFRPLNTNLVRLLFSARRLLGHTGYTYNGHGCSDELQDAIEKFSASHGMRAVSEGQGWWLSDDRTYYTNFVVGSVNFFLHPRVRELTAYLNEYPDGFFKHRWTDQSLLHKIMGVFCGPEESHFSLDWVHLRCMKTRKSPNAVFYHSKRRKKVFHGYFCRN